MSFSNEKPMDHGASQSLWLSRAGRTQEFNCPFVSIFGSTMILSRQGQGQGWLAAQERLMDQYSTLNKSCPADGGAQGDHVGVWKNGGRGGRGIISWCHPVKITDSSGDFQIAADCCASLSYWGMDEHSEETQKYKAGITDPWIILDPLHPPWSPWSMVCWTKWGIGSIMFNHHWSTFTRISKINWDVSKFHLFPLESFGIYWDFLWTTGQPGNQFLGPRSKRVPWKSWTATCRTSPEKSPPSWARSKRTVVTVSDIRWKMLG